MSQPQGSSRLGKGRKNKAVKITPDFSRHTKVTQITRYIATPSGTRLHSTVFIAKEVISRPPKRQRVESSGVSGPVVSACMTSPIAGGAHDATRQFFPVNSKDDVSHPAQVVAKSSSSRVQSSAHLSIVCDGCEKPIEGVRHKCLICGDHDFCDTCISNPSKRQGHNQTHAFFSIATVQDLVSYDQARIRAQSQGVLHESVGCDMCKQNPLVGVRHRCLDCEDYDLCADCLSNPDLRLQQDPTHAFFPITAPENMVSYTRALELRRMSPVSGGTRRPVQLLAKTSEFVSGAPNSNQVQ